MPVSVGYVARETGSNLWRNRVMTLAGVLVVAVSLSLAGVAVLLRQAVGNATVQWQHSVGVVVWMNPGLSAGQRQTIHHELTQEVPFIRTCTFKSQEQDYQEAKTLIDPPAFEVLTASGVPSSFRCVLTDPKYAQTVFDQFIHQPGITQVTYPSAAIRNMETVVHALQWAALVLALILLTAAAVLILNTIRLAIFARRREVSVMKLVGATNWFIRIPFMFEGLIQGLIGALVAAGLVELVHLALSHYAATTQQHELSTSSGQTVFTIVFVIIIGAVVGAAGSAIAIRRFLDT